MENERNKIEVKVHTVIAEHLDIDIERISNNSTWNELGADSLDQVELVMAFEKEYGLDIPDKVAEGIKNVNKAIEYILKNKQD